MFFGIGAYGVAIAATRIGPDLAGARARHRLRGRRLARPLAPHRPVQPARARDLLRDDHARGRVGVRDARVAALRLHRRRGWPDVQGAGGAAAGHGLPRRASARRLGRRAPAHLLPALPRRARARADLLRIVNSPFGRVLQAIRENDFRAEAIGYRTVVYRTIASVVSALFATLAGVLLALWLRYNGPDTTLSFEIMLDVLLIVVIGGMGTIYGAVVGSVLLVLAQNYLQDLMKLGESAVHGVPVLAQIVSPDRWLLWLGILFVLSVYYFPSGVVGRLRQLGARKAGA
jgi:ABC-type branched-subunit amino acid transport system permease subunit